MMYQNNKRKQLSLWLLAGSLCINLIFVIGLTGQWYAIRPLIVNKVHMLRYPATASSQAALSQIVQFIAAQHFASQSEKIDFVRNWVHENSLHLIDTEHDDYAFNTPQVLSMLWKTYQTEEAEAHLSCGPRTLAMKAILDELGIPSRVIMIFTDDNSEVNSHTFLEVFNQESQRWVAHDPDFNIYYVDQATQKRVSAARLLWYDLDFITPISSDKSGWEANQVEHLKQHYFEALMYMNHLHAEKSVILVNRDRFDPNKSYASNGNNNFYQFAEQHYGAPVFISNQGFQ